MKKFLIISVLFASLVTMIAFAVSRDSHHVPYVLYTHWTAQSQFGGYIVASEKGFYRDEKLPIALHFDDSVHNAIDMLRSGKAQFVTTTLSNAYRARLEGLKLVNVMQTMHHCSYSLLSHNKLKSAKDLAGKDIYVWHGFDEIFCRAINGHLPSPARWHQIFTVLEAFRARAVDVIPITCYNEQSELEESGYEIKADNIIKVSDLGLDIAEDGVYCTEDFFNSHRDVVEAFIRASIKGWQYSMDNIEESVQMVLEKRRKFSLSVNHYHEINMMREIHRLLKDESGTPSFTLSENEFNGVRDLYRKYGNGTAQIIDYKEFYPWTR